MPEIDANHIFLYHCLQTVDNKQVDIAAVAGVLGCNVPAARKRYVRLKERIKMELEKGGAKTVDASKSDEKSGENKDGDDGGDNGDGGKKEPKGKKRKTME